MSYVGNTIVKVPGLKAKRIIPDCPVHGKTNYRRAAIPLGEALF